MHVGCCSIIGAANLVLPLITVLESEWLVGHQLASPLRFGSARLFEFSNRRRNRGGFCTFCLCVINGNGPWITCARTRINVKGVDKILQGSLSL